MGAWGNAPCQPAPVPFANAITTTPPRAITLAAVTTFCTQRPEATPKRFTAVNSATNPTPAQGTTPAGHPRSPARNSPPPTPLPPIPAPSAPAPPPPPPPQ